MLGSILLSIALFIALMLGLETGFWLRRRFSRRHDETPNGSSFEGVVFALLGLMIAFTFSGAASRFDTRRTLILEQSNSLGTTWLRLDLLPAEAAQPIRAELKEWTRIALAIVDQASQLDAQQYNELLNEAADHQLAAW
ncbi:MAG TPA: hypothetical protein PK402_14210, partial [Tepidisphaeraceae bacterium]|nr:hypothetical protein [Tepidisphaeraceae bacterium]